jgi:type IV secretory pathway VirB4 component
VLTPGKRGHGLNPFVIDRGDESELLERIGGLRRLVEVMVGERLPAERRAILDDALTAYYTNGAGGKDGGSSTGFQDFFRFLERNGHDGFAGIASLLRPFATGSLRHLLTDEGADLVGHEAPLTVFNLRHLEPELRPAATLVCAEAVWTMATRAPKPRMLVVDEVWSIMQHPEGAAFMVSLAKRARKHRLGLVTITQDVQDFLGVDQSRPIVGHSGRVLLQNSAFKLLLQQDPAALRAVQEAFDLPPADAQWLTSCPRGEGLLVARGGRFPVRILATSEEQSLIEAKAAS